MKSPSSIVSLPTFIEAIRDSGYKSLSAAVAELIDNSLQANAKHVSIFFLDSMTPDSVAVCDDGTGMESRVLAQALRFGWSSRFNDRSGCGRYGMGLPASSLSQARRVEVYSWTNSKYSSWCYLDVDLVADGTVFELPKPSRKQVKQSRWRLNRSHGTTVVWSKCDRINISRRADLVVQLKHELGRLFRHALWAGKKIKVNSEIIRPRDPLYIRSNEMPRGAKSFGPALEFNIRENVKRTAQSSKVNVRFVELPVEKWHKYSNEEKTFYGISKGAGLSVVRAGREVDFGWYFMGKKRKENYDDWWRGEISFEPALDHLFGVSHTKQGIRPVDTLVQIIAPEIEKIAHQLNGRVRQRFLNMKRATENSRVAERATRSDCFLPPPLKRSRFAHQPRLINDRHSKHRIGGFNYSLVTKPLDDASFYRVRTRKGALQLILNKNHPFFEKIYGIARQDNLYGGFLKDSIETLLFAAARAEVGNSLTRDMLERFRLAWSHAVVVFLR